MAFSPVARFRNFTLENLKALLEVYPDEARAMSWDEAAGEIEVISPGYKRTAYQQACQLGLEDRGSNRFRIHNYLFTFDDVNLERYLQFWIKTYYAPNPYVKGNDAPFLIYCEIVKEILASPGYEIKYDDFFLNRIGGKSNDILLNAIKNYAEPVRVKKVNNEDILYMEAGDVQRAEKELDFIENQMPIGNADSKREFFDRFSYGNFCSFFGIGKTAGLNFQTGFQSPFPRNRIVFGAPGTGKSYRLNREKDVLLGKDSSDFERVTFHPNFSYANFVGTYKPVSEKEETGKDTIRYEYVPGPFMRVYVKALESGRKQEHVKPYLLLIEEINRANVAAVFGEIFQLLDRDGSHVSEYAVHATEDMKKYLADRLQGEPEDYAEIRIPDNMFIWATMNSADQGVFPMDTAFKRRWEFEYIGVDEEAEGVENAVIPVGMGAGRKYVVWNDLRCRVNHILSSEECRLNEDKLLGPYFISKSRLDHALEDEDQFVKAFEGKVLMYLFEDAMKMRPANIFKGHKGKMIFSEICKTFEERGEELFGISDMPDAGKSAGTEE